MNSPDSYQLLTKGQLLEIGTKILSDLYDAASEDVKKKNVQMYWYQALHEFSAKVMMNVINDDFEAEQCPTDMVRCWDGSCMPPGQC